MAGGCRLRRAAFGIVRAADEGAELAELQRQLEAAVAAGRAFARIDPRLRLGREDVGASTLVRVASSTSVTRSSLVSPTAAENSVQNSRSRPLPVELAAGDFVELFFEVGGEIVFDIALEEASRGRW
jgi:hypothetical protein